ncbi:MAG: chemotaxis protein CheD [Syntrophorhabdales bacterium]|jgi:chemotaxis protein CheD
MRIFLKPGECYLGQKHALVSTVLGSCISVTMFSDALRTGAICHALLPMNAAPQDVNMFRYVDSSIYSMLRYFDAMGVGKGALKVKVFGGADLLPSLRDRTVGRANIERAVAIVRSENLELVTSDVGGFQGRKIIFNTLTGSVFLKRIKMRGFP